MPTVARFLLALTLCLLSRADSQSTESALVAELVQSAGTTTGLALHLGCGRSGTPDRTAALAQRTGMLVHGLALDEAACARAQRALEASGATGRAMVECVPVGPLPYLPDLANLVVVMDADALAAKGVTHAELLRVLAPGGLLCLLKGDRWIKSVKPRPEETDDWTHIQHGPDGNMVSQDRVVQFPPGFRWLDGLPINLNRWASCRG